jgi:hypothetical protein
MKVLWLVFSDVLNLSAFLCSQQQNTRCDILFSPAVSSECMPLFAASMLEIARKYLLKGLNARCGYYRLYHHRHRVCHGIMHGSTHIFSF